MAGASLGGEIVAPGPCGLVEKADRGASATNDRVHEGGIGEGGGVDVEGGWRVVVVVAKEEEVTAFAYGAEVVDGEGA